MRREYDVYKIIDFMVGKALLSNSRDLIKELTKAGASRVSYVNS